MWNMNMLDRLCFPKINLLVAPVLLFFFTWYMCTHKDTYYTKSDFEETWFYGISGVWLSHLINSMAVTLDYLWGALFMIILTHIKQWKLVDSTITCLLEFPTIIFPMIPIKPPDGVILQTIHLIFFLFVSFLVLLEWLYQIYGFNFYFGNTMMIWT